MTVFHIVQRMAPGGIESVVLDLARQDRSVEIVSLEGSHGRLLQAWPVLGEIGSRLHALNKGDGIQATLWLRLSRLFSRHHAVAVVTHHIGPLVYAGVAARVAGIPRRIHVEHDGWHYATPRRRKLGQLVNAIVQPARVAASHITAQQVREALGTLRQTIIPNGVDLSRFRPRSMQEARLRFNLPPDQPLIGSVGRLEKVKGHDVLIDAFRKLPGSCHLAIAGNGSEWDALNRKARANGLEARIHFLGQVDEPEWLYPAFDLFCLPSRAEGFPRAVIEAQSCGVPVVATDVGGSREAVCARSGRLVSPENPEELASALKDMLCEPSPASPRAHVDPVFSSALMLDRYRALVAG